MEWIKTSEKAPKIGYEVLGKSTKWVHPDFNPRGIRICFHDDLSGWVSSKWDNCGDTYENGKEGQVPEFWRPLPEHCNNCGSHHLVSNAPRGERVCHDCYTVHNWEYIA